MSCRRRWTRFRGETERQALQRLCGELATTPLDPARPLWQFQLIEDYEGGSAMIARVHHCIGDGIALISVMLSITDGGSDPPTAPPARQAGAARTTDDGDWLTRAVLEPVTDLTVKAIGMYGERRGEVAGPAGRPAVDRRLASTWRATGISGGQRRGRDWR